jgi:hypothetical protein
VMTWLGWAMKCGWCRARPRGRQCYDASAETRQNWEKSYLEPLRSLSCN